MTLPSQLSFSVSSASPKHLYPCLSLVHNPFQSAQTAFLQSHDNICVCKCNFFNDNNKNQRWLEKHISSYFEPQHITDLPSGEKRPPPCACGDDSGERTWERMYHLCFPVTLTTGEQRDVAARQTSPTKLKSFVKEEEEIPRTILAFPEKFSLLPLIFLVEMMGISKYKARFWFNF